MSTPCTSATNGVATPAGQPSADDLDRNAKEDDTISRLEATLAAMHAARRGRLVNGNGLAWCSACGAVRCRLNLANPEEAKLNDGRAMVACGRCKPDGYAVEALARYLYPPPEIGLISCTFEEWAEPRIGRPIPETLVRRFAAAQLERSRENIREFVAAVAASDRHLIFIEWGAAAVLQVAGDDADRELAERCLALARAGRKAA